MLVGKSIKKSIFNEFYINCECSDF